MIDGTLIIMMVKIKNDFNKRLNYIKVLKKIIILNHKYLRYLRSMKIKGTKKAAHKHIGSLLIIVL